MQIIADRRALHQIPELELHLPKTMEYIYRTLFGLKCRVFSPSESALFAYFDFGAKSTIAFTGKLDLHPDKNKIIDFIETRNIHPVYLTDKEIFDIGGIVPLTENSTC